MILFAQQLISLGHPHTVEKKASGITHASLHLPKALYEAIDLKPVPSIVQTVKQITVANNMTMQKTTNMQSRQNKNMVFSIRYTSQWIDTN